MTQGTGFDSLSAPLSTLQSTKRYSVSPTCSVELERQEKETGADLRLSLKLFKKCQSDYKVCKCWNPLGAQRMLVATSICTCTSISG